MNLNELPDMSSAYQEVLEKKKLDPVGQEDADVDNDGDVDSSDKYLKKRRAAIGKALKKEEKNIRGYDSDEQKKRLEKKRGMKLDDHPQYKKEEVEELEETKLGDKAYARARDAGAQRRRTKEYKQGLNRSTTRKEKGMYRLATAQRRTDADLERQKATYDTGRHKGDWDREKRAKQYKKEAFAFSDIELEELALLEEIDAMSDEQLIDMMEDLIIETAEDIDDLIEICEHLEEVEVLTEERDAGAMAREKLNKPAGPSRMDRLKSAAKAAGSRLKAGAAKVGAAAKKGIKAAGKSAAANAGKAVGTFQANRIKAKRAELSKPSEKKKEAPKSSSSDDDGTGGKLDALLAKTRGTSSSSSSDSDSGSSSSGGGGSSSSSSSSGSTRKAVGGALRKVGSLLKKGLKKAVGKTARVVSKGSDKLAKRLGEDYEQIADMYESGIFTIEEIENVVELYKGKHGQSEKEYADSRSPGGKMVSGDSKGSGAEYTHGRRVKAANPGMQPDVGGKTKPKSQGRMDAGTRADLQYRKANLKKKD